MKPGCLNCTERTFNCHSTCEKYLEFKMRNKEIKRIKYLEMEADSVAIENVLRVQRATRR